MVTINKRETSFEGLVSRLENGENGIYNMIAEDKNIIFQPKVTITKQDIEDIQPLQQLRAAIEYWENKMKTTTGREAYIIKRTLIDLRKDQYVIKNAYRRPIVPNKIIRSRYSCPIEETFNGFDAENYPKFSGVTLTDPAVCSAILCNYSKLKEDSWGNFEGDVWCFLYDFEDCCDTALRPYPIYERIVECKIDGKQNAEIQAILKKEFNCNHSVEYISSLWRKKIPSLIASTAEDKWLEWYYTTQEQGYFKKCNRCGKIKLGHLKYFSRNRSSKDGLYSLCKECRSKSRSLGRKVQTIPTELDN